MEQKSISTRHPWRELLRIDDDTFYFSTADSGTAGAYATLSERLRITSAGLVGIGTSSPQRTLHVNGSGQIGNTLFPTGPLGILEIGNTTLPSIALRRGTIAANGNVIGSIATYAVESSGLFDNRLAAGIDFVANGGPNFYQPTHITFSTESDNATSAYAERMRITSAGNVGIGTASPSTTLSIGASASSSYNGGVCLNRGPSVYNFYEASDGTNSVIFGLDPSLTSAKIGSVNSYPIGFFTGNSERARIDSSGRLLVGTSSARSNFFRSCRKHSGRSRRHPWP
jgi:hypothetical protein